MEITLILATLGTGSMVLKLSQKTALLIVLPFCFEVTFVTVLVNAQKALEAEYEREFKAKDELNLINAELRVMLEAGASLGMYHATRDQNFLERFRRCHADLQKLQKTLLSKSTLENELDVSEFNKGVQEVVTTFDRMEVLVNSGDRLDLMRSVFAGNALAGKISAMGNAILAKANSVNEAQRKNEAKLRTALDYVVLTGLFLNIVGVILMAVVFHKSTTGRLNVLWKNARNITSGLSLEPALTGNDEIAAIDNGLHQMAEALAAARDRELAFTENAVDVICAFDKSGQIQRINRASSNLFGYQAKDLLNTSIFDLVKPSERARSAELLLKATDREVTPFEVTMLRKDGAERIVQWALRWSGIERGFFAVFHDISEQKRTERLRQEVVAMVSHDLRSPLTAVDLSLSMLQAGSYGAIEDKAKMVLARSRESLGRLIAMINTLLDVEKLESGSIKLDYSTVSSKVLLDKAIDTVVALAESKGIGFTSTGSNTEIRCDAEKIISVIVNLLSNAIKFSPADSVISINVIQDLAFTKIDIKDQGRGVPAENKELIFERFKQSEKTDETQLKGSGLGLAICKAIVEAHNGDIGVTDNREGGSCFWFCLPI
ncbi:MAG: PAS domain S-box protein [Cyanobacteria bacterium REEB67]|nr:PAS domain S-box protein [Cyanobacteria bacterium REEB67]